MKIATPKCPSCKKDQSEKHALFLYSLPLRKGKRQVKKFRFGCGSCLKKLGAVLGPKIPTERYNVNGSNPSGKL